MGSILEKMETGSPCAADETPLLGEETEINQMSDNGVSVDSSQIEIEHKGPPRTPWFVYIVSFISAIGGFLFGYDTGVVSGATLPIKEQFDLSTIYIESFVSITVGAAAVFALLAGFVNDKLGRKPTTLIASVLFTLGAFLLAGAQNKETLLIGRAILGMGIGFASMVVPVYIAETSPPDQRGRLGSLNQLCISFGQLIANISAGALCTAEGGWRWMLGLAAVPAIIQFVAFIFMPESPRWLVRHGKHDQAKKVLRKIRGTLNVHQEFEDIRQACEDEDKANIELGGKPVIVQVFTTSTVRRALLIGCSLQAFQQLCGINTIMYYSASIIRMSGVRDQCKAIWLACITAASNFFPVFIGIALVDRIGRRKLYIGSLTAVALALIFMGVTFQVENAYAPEITVYNNFSKECGYNKHTSCHTCSQDADCGFCYTTQNNSAVNGSCLLVNKDDLSVSVHGECTTQSESSKYIFATDYCPTPYSWMSVLGMVIYLICFSSGLGMTPWCVNSEIYPLWARSFGNSLSTFCNWLFNLIISLTFLSLSEEIGKPGAFYLYTSITVVGVIWFLLVLPETKGRTLEEMQGLFSGSWLVFRKSRQNQVR